MSFLSSLVNIVNQFTLQISSGFVYQPLTKLRLGSIFSDMQNSINYVDQAGKYFFGQSYGSASIMSKPGFTQAQDYKPGDTTPPKSYPTHQPDGYVVPLGVNEASMYSFSAEALRHLKNFEGLHQRPYIINGVKYIGYGHKMSESDTMTYVSRDAADALLTADVAKAVATVKGALSGKVSQGQFDAMVDFAFTTTAPKFKNSTVIQKLNGGDMPGAATALAQWIYGTQNGIMAKFPHLAARRTANVQWFTSQIDPLALTQTNQEGQ